MTCYMGLNMIHRFSSTSNSPKPLGQGSSLRSDIQRVHSPLQIHDPDSRDIVLANRLAQELIHISGASVIVYPRTENESYDKVWEEDADPTYKAGIQIKGWFAPKPTETQLRPWGVDIENQTTVVFCRDEVYQLFKKRMIREGDIIELPYDASLRRLDRFRVLNAFDSGNFRYGWLYYSCVVENITDDKNIDIQHR